MLDLRLALPDDVQHQAVGDYPIYVKCVRHADKKRPNMAVYPDHLHCYVCGYTCGCAHPGPEHGPRCPQFQLEALAALLGVDIETARTVAPQYTNESLDAYRERAYLEAKRTPLPRALATAYHRILLGARAERLEWLYERGLTDASIDSFKLGHDGFRFVIPVFDKDGNLLTLRYRRDDVYQSEQRPKYSGLPGRNGFYVYPEWRLRDETWVMVCEGELDAVRCWQEGWPAVSATNGARQVPKLIPALQELLPHLDTVLLATDSDEAGEEAANVAGRDAQARGLRVERCRWDDAKDITDALRLGRRLRREPLGRRDADTAA
jgi:DNA primase